jgi:hypothetical protein
MSVLGQYFLRRAQRQRESAWQALDAEAPRWAGILTDLPPVRDIRRRAIDDYVQNGGDLRTLHRQAALDMSRRFLAMELLMGPNIPYVVHRGLYPDHERQLTSEWLRGRRWLGLTTDRHREALGRMRDSPPGSQDYEAACRFDEAFADWLQHGTPANMEEHHGHAAAQLELALEGATFHL